MGIPERTRQQVSEETRVQYIAFGHSFNQLQKTSVSLRGGQISLVTIRPFHESIGSHLYNTIARWIRNRVRVQTRSDS
jgi:hypothetical protein